MRHFVLLLFFTTTLTAQKPFTVEDIFSNNTFNAKGIPGFNFQNDGNHYTRRNGTLIEQYDLRTGDKTATLLDVASLTSADTSWKKSIDGYAFNSDESKILLQTNTRQIYRHSSESHFFVLDRATQSLTRLHTGSKQRYANISPDGKKVAYVADNNLWYKDLETGINTQVTTDGKTNEIINGASDWVYEEEFKLVRAFEWSPDGAKIAFLRFDEREVPEMTMEMHRGGAYPELVTFKYPKVGEKNATVSAFIYDLPSKRTIPVNTETEADSYMPRLAWTPNGKLCLTWLNRHQNNLKLLLADPATGTCKTLLEEKNKYYLDLHDVHFLADGSGFVWQSEKSGFNHLYVYDMNGREKTALTKGKWDMTALYGVDEKNGMAYYQSAAQNPMQREIFSVKLNGKSKKKLSGAPGFHSAQFSKTFDYFVKTSTTINTPARYSVHDRKGDEVRMLEDNSRLLELQRELGVASAQFFDFKTSEGVSLNGWMIKPTAPEFENQKLPVLMFVYGGPGSQQVTDQWKGANYWWFQMLAQKGYVVACVDNRGTGARGEEFKKMTYQQLGHYETLDQIEAAKYMGTLSFVDPARVGIFGWSYGGYMSSLCMLKGGEVFKTGVAVAPVTNWKWYDSVYTERYMRTNEENPDGYENNTPTNFADQLTGNYLLIHGIADDNVHFQHTAEMANQLIAANKQFDTMIYPNQNHGIGSSKLHLYTLMTRFLDEKLKGVSTGDGVRP